MGSIVYLFLSMGTAGFISSAAGFRVYLDPKEPAFLGFLDYDFLIHVVTCP